MSDSIEAKTEAAPALDQLEQERAEGERVEKAYKAMRALPASKAPRVGKVVLDRLAEKEISTLGELLDYMTACEAEMRKIPRISDGFFDMVWGYAAKEVRVPVEDLQLIVKANIPDDYVTRMEALATAVVEVAGDEEVVVAEDKSTTVIVDDASEIEVAGMEVPTPPPFNPELEVTALQKRVRRLERNVVNAIVLAIVAVVLSGVGTGLVVANLLP